MEQACSRAVVDGGKLGYNGDGSFHDFLPYLPYLIKSDGPRGYGILGSLSMFRVGGSPLWRR
jgi:hypothetical protein